jgi:mono/diheme cytochrome c family protein
MASTFRGWARGLPIAVLAVVAAAVQVAAVHGQTTSPRPARPLAARAADAAPSTGAGGKRVAATPSSPAAASPGAPAPAALDSVGSKIYQQVCATCHMPDGAGVPGMQPALLGSKVVSGPATMVIKVLLLGPDKALPPHKPAGGNQMPAFDSLSDEEIASVATYVRKTFGKNASAVTPAQVKAQRPK